MTLTPVPAEVRRADDLLPAARRLVDRVAEAAARDPDLEVSCRLGCTRCCTHAVPATGAEVRAVLAAVERLDPDRRRRVRERIADADRRLAAEGIDEWSFAETDAATVDRLNRRYFSLGLDCPLLEDGACTVYADRPLACRAYLVSSDPEHCDDPTSGRVVRIRGRRDAARGFRRVARELGDGAVLVLGPALARPLAGPVDVEPRSGPRLAAAMTSPATAEVTA